MRSLVYLCMKSALWKELGMIYTDMVLLKYVVVFRCFYLSQESSTFSCILYVVMFFDGLFMQQIVLYYCT